MLGGWGGGAAPSRFVVEGHVEGPGPRSLVCGDGDELVAADPCEPLAVLAVEVHISGVSVISI